MTGLRSRKEQLKYGKFLKTHDKNICPFCIINKDSPFFIEETEHFRVIMNQFPYTLMDSQPVVEHFMITPKNHIASIKDLTSDAKVEYINLLEKYHKKGYNSFTRAGNSVIRSIDHYHTHLLKPGDIVHRFVIAIRKPYIRIAK
ncbi:MAG: hypothetical protein JWM52_275 [Candidatus Saccharibacteria bacterium]|nr:hypothetical protein [Candidatus Saccharibacteria bacterium]